VIKIDQLFEWRFKMVVSIEEDRTGRLVLDFSQEHGLAQNPEVTDVLLAFPIASRAIDRVVLDIPGGQVITSVDYLKSRLEGLHASVAVSPELQLLLNRFQSEMVLAQEIRQASNQDSAEEIVVPNLRSTATLLPHQARGVRQALRNNNLAEFSVQGSGKTAVILSAFSIWRNRGEVEHMLVIGPVSCFQPWEDEVSRCFGDSISVLRWSGSLSERTKMVRSFGAADVVLCSYDTAWRDVGMLYQLVRSHKTLLALDESHYIKSFNVGARGAAVLQLAPYAAKRTILTGTPSPHSMLDIWTQFSFLWPNANRVLLGTASQYQEFLEQSHTPARELHERLRPFYHRTTQGELNLPPPESHFVSIAENNVPPQQARIIDLLEMRVLAEAKLRLTRFADRDVLAQWQRARIVRLLQAASNPGLLLNPTNAPSEVGDIDFSDLIADVSRFQRGELTSAKISWTVQTARELVQNGNKVIIWTWWVENLHLLSRLLADHHPLLLYGAIKPYEEETDDVFEQSRERNIREFRSRDDRPILLANPSACAEAISLHRECHHSIYLDRTFNCGQFLQSLNRIHRVGLPAGVTTHYWLPILECAVEHTVDQRLRERQQRMYEFLGDETPVIGIPIEEESDIADTYSELDQDFGSIVQEISSGHERQRTGQDAGNP
jgi:SNF2 family DNA or RNA helicase